MPDMRTELDIHRELDQRNFVISIDQPPNDADLELAVLWTLAYADVFDYPLPDRKADILRRITIIPG